MDHIETEIARYLRGDLTTSEQSAFINRLSKSPKGQTYFEELKAIWEQSQDLRPSFSPDPNTAWHRFQRKIGNGVGTNFYQIKNLIKIAAAIVLIAVVSIFIWVKDPSTTYTSGADKLFDIELPDGSKAWLNENSSISFDDTKTSRTIMLKGEGYLEIAPDRERPFEVITGQLITRVVGTSFNVNAISKDSIRVTVLSGVVALFNQSRDSLLLSAEQTGIFRRSTKTLIKRPIGDLNFLAWKTGILRFDRTPMQAVVKTLEKHYKVDLEWDETSTSSLTGTFDNRSLEEVISLIELSTDTQLSY